jgi:N-carbamoylputrescine amidase
MSRVVRAALTETSNAFAGMPERVEDLGSLAGRLDEVRAANVEHHVDLIRRAADAGAQVIGLGELFTGPYFALHEDELWFGLAEDALDGPTVTTLRGVARARGIVIVAPLYELDPESGRRFNTAVVIDEHGEPLGRFRKIHIPAGSNERAAFCETFYYGPGDLGFPVFDTSLGKLGVSICYDRHFPGSVASLAAAGAELVFSPAVTFGEQSRRLWELEFQVDAARHRLFIGGSNRRGAEPPWNVDYFGASHFAGPGGVAPPLDAPAGLVLADLDLGSLSGADASGWDLCRDARPDAYGA